MTGIGAALVDVVLQGVAAGGPRVRRVVDWIADAARPPAGVRLVADDGTEYTGLVLVEANRPRLMFALRVGAQGRPVNQSRDPHYMRPDLDDELWPYGHDLHR